MNHLVLFLIFSGHLQFYPPLITGKGLSIRIITTTITIRKLIGGTTFFSSFLQSFRYRRLIRRVDFPRAPMGSMMAHAY